MKSKPFIGEARDDERSELLRRLAAALEPKPLHEGRVSTSTSIAAKTTVQKLHL